MKLETAFTCGGRAFILTGRWGESITEMTVGRVTVEMTDSPGADPDAEIDGMPARDFSNYAPQRAHRETIMCVETGIGSGSVYTYDEHAFTSMEAAQEGAKRMQAKHAEQIAQEAAYKRKRDEEDLRHARARLAEAEARVKQQSQTGGG